VRCAVDEAKRRAIEACGNCGQPEDAHKFDGGIGQDDLALFAVLGGPCTKFVASDAAVIVQKYLAITDNRAPQRKPGRIGKRLPLHQACGHRHHPGSCPFQSGTGGPGPDTATRWAARAREALGLPPARRDTPESS
jgi:hypothetical protein